MATGTVNDHSITHLSYLHPLYTSSVNVLLHLTQKSVSCSILSSSMLTQIVHPYKYDKGW